MSNADLAYPSTILTPCHPPDQYGVMLQLTFDQVAGLGVIVRSGNAAGAGKDGGDPSFARKESKSATNNTPKNRVATE